MLHSAILAALLATSAFAQCEGWTEIPGPRAGISGNVVTTEVFDFDGDGPEPSQLVMGGSDLFTESGPGCVFRWDGARWRRLGDGLDVAVYTLKSWRGTLYAGGVFTQSGGTRLTGFARWNGASWEPVPGGELTLQPSNVRPYVRGFIEFGGELVMYGLFDTVGGASLRNLASYDGVRFAPLGAGTNNIVGSAAIHNGDLIVGGTFTSAGSVAASRLARWNGSAWSAVGPASNDQGANGRVRAIISKNGKLLLGGEFTRVGRATNAPYLAALGSSGWESLGSANGFVRAMLDTPDGVVATGAFTTIDGSPMGGLATWTGSGWSDRLGHMQAHAQYDTTPIGDTLAWWNNGLLVGGGFGVIDGVHRPKIAWHGPDGWHGFSQGLGSGNINTLANFQGKTYAGGDFLSYSGKRLSGLAVWTPRGWEPVPGWAGPALVRKIEADGSALWVYAAPVQPATGPVFVGRFDGETWSYSSTGPQAASEGGEAVLWRGVLAVAHRDGVDLWDGTAWTPLPPPEGWSVANSRLATDGDRLYLSTSSTRGPLITFDGEAWSPNEQVPGTPIFAMTRWGNRVALVSAAYGLGIFDEVGYQRFFDSGDYEVLSPAAVGDDLYFVVNPASSQTRPYTGKFGRDYQFTRVIDHYGAETWPLGDFLGRLLTNYPYSAGGGSSDISDILVQGAPDLIAGPLPHESRCRREPIRLDVRVIAYRPTYQWRRNGVEIPGATSAELEIRWPSAGDIGDYDCVVSNGCGTVVSDPVAVSVCVADHNCDGFVDFFDYDGYIVDFTAGYPTADFNGDGFIDFFDYADFITLFETGC